MVFTTQAQWHKLLLVKGDHDTSSRNT